MTIDTTYTNYFEKNEVYLDNFLENFSAGRIVKNPSSEIRTLASEARALWIASHANERRELPKLLHHLYILHLESLSHLKKGDLSSRALMILKHTGKLDSFFKEQRGFQVFFELAKEGVLKINKYLVKNSGSDTANQPRFVYSFERAKPLMVYKRCRWVVKSRDPACLRQVAAYLIDRRNGGTAGVPLSVMGVWKKNIGSLQLFKKNEGELFDIASDIGVKPEVLAAISPDDLQRLALFRTRLFDRDGHDGNVLYRHTKDGKLKLIPIDFDFALPQFRVDKRVDPTRSKSSKPSTNSMGLPLRLRFDMQFYPQLDVPMSDKLKTAILSLSPEKDAEILEQLHFKKSCIRLMKGATWVWQEGVTLNLTAGQIVDFLADPIFIYCIRKPLNKHEALLKSDLASTLKDYKTRLESHHEELSKAYELFQKFGDARYLLSQLSELGYRGGRRLVASWLNKIIQEQPKAQSVNILLGLLKKLTYAPWMMLGGNIKMAVESLKP